MDVKIKAITETGNEALNKALGHSHNAIARAIAKVVKIDDDPLTVSFTAKALSRLPNSVLNNPAIQTTINAAVSEMMKGYGAGEKDYEVLY